MTSRRGIFWLLAGLTILALARPAPAAEQVFSKWFRYGADVELAWEVRGDPANPLQVVIRSKDAKDSAPAYRVLVLYPRASSAYDTEITRILRVFDDKEVNAEFTIINFEIKDDAGKAAIRYAENNKFNLIYTMGSESTAWIYDNYFGGALPVVSVCSKDPVQLGQMKDYEHGSATNFAYTSLNVQVRGSAVLSHGHGPRSQESRHPGGFQECKRGQDPGGADCGCCPQRRHPADHGCRAGSEAGTR